MATSTTSARAAKDTGDKFRVGRRVGKPGDEVQVEQDGAAIKLLADYASKEELAEDLDVSPRTIERWVRLRLLPEPVRLGRTRLFHIPTIRRHWQSQTYTKRPYRSRQA